MTKFVSIEPLEMCPSVVFDMQDVKVIANHYDYDFASCYVKNCGFNNNLIAHQGYCLVKDGEAIMNLNELVDWQNDIELLKKFYLNDKKRGFIEKTMTFEEYCDK
ncbi:MAG: hypothetical protein IKG40_01590 [Bacilli bacterium]|nr:hypothetical protein [Bacilli bacterium]